MRTENEIEAMGDRASHALTDPDDPNNPSEGWYSEEYLRGVRDAMDWAMEFVDDEPVKDRKPAP